MNVHRIMNTKGKKKKTSMIANAPKMRQQLLPVH